MWKRVQLLLALFVAFGPESVNGITSQVVPRALDITSGGLALDEEKKDNDYDDQAAAQEQTAEQKVALAKQDSASSTYGPCNDKYECTWRATGCPSWDNDIVRGWGVGGGWWSLEPTHVVMVSMFNYCRQSFTGQAPRNWRDFCCGNGKTCTPHCALQSDWVLPGGNKYPKTQCMSKLLCYDEVPPEKMNNNTWKCMCLLPPHSEEQRFNKECSDYFECIEEKHAQQTDSFEEVLKAIQDLSGIAGGGALADLGETHKLMRGEALEASEQTCQDTYSPSSSCSYWKGQGYCTSFYVSWMKNNCHKTCGYCSEDEPECRVPESMDIEAIDCACGAKLREECEAKGESEKQKCWRGVLCTNTNVCNSWQMKHCSEEERSYQMLLELKVDPEFLFNSSDKETPDGTALEESILDKRSC